MPNSSIRKMIQNMLAEVGSISAIQHPSANHWQLKQGSATIHLVYDNKTGFIHADAYLCQLNSANHEAIFKYLLKLNANLGQLKASIHDSDVVLSVIMYDKYLNVKEGGLRLVHLLKEADKLDNILVEKYGCNWSST